ncbi:uncharacterized protein LOC130893439 [Diorhabda carinulata]|uniref:uncharacterized protein LOC130893439 n=1 Tax=Diorhabda carinulata TaxID=1163345 RepID=UPI0025A0EC5C|nr:uncharacterized protein LOC130893439 [Diorhabda carinulata]
MRALLIVYLLCVVRAEPQLWDSPNLLHSWFRQARSDLKRDLTTKPPSSITTTKKIQETTIPLLKSETVTKLPSTLPFYTETTPKKINLITSTISSTDGSTIYDTTVNDFTETTEEPRDNSRNHDFYLSKRERPQIKISTNISQNLLPLPAGASAALVKPTKYHYYPHNQHIYLLPECAIQQVCNAVYIRLNWTQPLCACPSRYRDPCSASLNSDDQHTTELMTDRNSRKALTLVKTCEPIAEMRLCRSPRDWSLLALQNIRSGKSHYLVICRCPDTSILEGPMSHDQPTYASVPGIRVFGMMCVDGRKDRQARKQKSLETPQFPWEKAIELARTALWD